MRFRTASSLHRWVHNNPEFRGALYFAYASAFNLTGVRSRFATFNATDGTAERISDFPVTGTLYVSVTGEGGTRGY